MALSERTLLSLLSNDPACNQAQPISEKYPQVTFAYMKHLWQGGQKQQAFRLLSRFVMTHQRPLLATAEDEDNTKLLSRYKNNAWHCGNYNFVFHVHVHHVHHVHVQWRFILSSNINDFVDCISDCHKIIMEKMTAVFYWYACRLVVALFLQLYYLDIEGMNLY